MKYHNKIIEILGEKWTIRRVSGLYEQGTRGRCIFSKKLIELDVKLKPSELEHTLLHELFHALIYRASIYQALSHDLEEIIVDIFSTFLNENFSLNLLKKRK